MSYSNIDNNFDNLSYLHDNTNTFDQNHSQSNTKAKGKECSTFLSNKNSSGKKMGKMSKQIGLTVNEIKTPQSIHSKGDRFIPVRSNNSEGHLQYILLNNKENVQLSEKQRSQNHNTIDVNDNHNSTSSLLNNFMLDSLLLKTTDSFAIDKSQIKKSGRDRVLSFTQKVSTSGNMSSSNGNMPLISQIKNLLENKSVTDPFGSKTVNLKQRDIPTIPERILDAPNLVDDYYLNLIDWSSQNTLAVSLGTSVYLWNGSTCETLQLMSSPENICSVNWMDSGTCLAIGTKEGVVELWDTVKNTPIRKMKGHEDRIGSLSWNNCMLTSGSKDSKIINHDVRARDHITHRLNYHNQEVCALKWSCDGTLLASGGNDNTLCIWDVRASNTETQTSIWDVIDGNRRNNIVFPKFVFNQHEAAVKAIAWCPWQSGVLATGAGTKDRTIKFWNTQSGTLTTSIDTGSQVCGLLWNKHEKELISSHGYSKNQITIWKYPTMNKIIELNGHMSRVLYLAMSPDGCTVVSGAGDETLRFWKINDEKKIRCNSSEMDFNLMSSSSKIMNSFQMR